MRFPIRTLATLVLALSGLTLAAADLPRPNIVILLADDLGYADVGFTGAKDIKTPNVDRLAASGVRLEQYYVQPLCTPTRAALLTGRYPMRYGLQMGVLLPYEQRGLPLTERLLPQALREAGYTTAIVGKWHLGEFSREYLPTYRGFDHQYGHYNGQIDYFTHEREGGFDWHRDDKECRDEGYSTDLIAKEAVRLIHSYTQDKPFFLYVPFNAVHSPFEARESDKEPYKDLREPRRTYAGMVTAMDTAIGEILGALHDRGFSTNTLILFSSDNGGPSPGRITDNGPLRAGKGSLYEGGVRVCACVAWEGHIKPNSTLAAPLHAVDWYPTLLNLANAAPKQQLPLDGRNIWPLLTGEQKPSPREILLNTTPKATAVRVGDWKLVTKYPGEDGEVSAGPAKGPKKEELFNVVQDIGETHNLASKNPEKLLELRKRAQDFEQQAVKPTNQSKPENFTAPRVWGEP